ncbi:sugar phosphate isomerase/epimerase [Paenibacillus sp. J22TS3]|uniref:sugar phosphate isomerase/epimerase family protein n=1 Tax=Paenibacillus sp. J22TS3 TaxID=2807192 RepID=UPI001B011D8F|nr:sugar phosphate isomerase/epimerase [Paenibacillus sp. J22TS3]GIP20274.1 sugar phosphate isomerase [Paenibacillus sp. J22TS3]
MTKIGLQLYTVRESLEQDFEGTIRKVAELGYHGVEFAGYYGRTAEQVKELLAETGLEALGSHIGYERLKQSLGDEVAFNQIIGNKYLIIPYLSEDQRKGWQGAIDGIRSLGMKAAEEDMVLLYHNHDFELSEEYEGQPALDAMFSQVPASLLQAELDTCWVHFAGYDPVEYILKYTGRLPLVHFKDMVTKADGSAETVELGQGEVDLKAIADAAVASGAEWLVVEQDECLRNDPLKCIEISMEWIKNYRRQGGQIHV